MNETPVTPLSPATQKKPLSGERMQLEIHRQL